jgi:hypothetical protein
MTTEEKLGKNGWLAKVRKTSCKPRLVSKSTKQALIGASGVSENCFTDCTRISRNYCSWFKHTVRNNLLNLLEAVSVHVSR